MLLTYLMQLSVFSLPRHGCHPTAELGTRAGTQGQGKSVAPGEGHPESTQAATTGQGPSQAGIFPVA